MYFTCNGPQRSPLLYFYKRGGSFIGYLSRMRDSTVHHWWRIGHFPVRKWPPFLLVYIIAVETCLQQRRKEPSSQASLKSNPPVEWIRAVGRVIVVPKLRPPPEWSLYRWECSRLRLPSIFQRNTSKLISMYWLAFSLDVKLASLWLVMRNQFWGITLKNWR